MIEDSLRGISSNSCRASSMSAAAPSTGALARAAPPALSCVLLFAAGAHGAHDGGVEHAVPQAAAVARQKALTGRTGGRGRRVRRRPFAGAAAPRPKQRW